MRWPLVLPITCTAPLLGPTIASKTRIASARKTMPTAVGTGIALNIRAQKQMRRWEDTILSVTETEDIVASATAGVTGAAACDSIDADDKSEAGRGDSDTKEEDANDGWNELYTAGNWSPEADAPVDAYTILSATETGGNVASAGADADNESKDTVVAMITGIARLRKTVAATAGISRIALVVGAQMRMPRGAWR